MKTKRLTIAVMEKRINRGVRWLNGVQSDWLDRIDIATLNLDGIDVCVCGQVFGNFWNVIYRADTRLGRANRNNKKAMSKKQAILRGLYLDNGGSHRYDTLTRLWEKKIRKLQKRAL